MRQFTTYLAVVLGSIACGALRADDSKAQVVSIEVLIADLAGGEQGDDEEAENTVTRIREAEKQGKLSRVTRLRLTTLTEQVAMAQFGERAAIPTGRASFPSGGRGGSGNITESFTYQNLGTMAQLTPRVEGNKVTMECNVEQSRLAAKEAKGVTVGNQPAPAPAPAASFQPDSIETITAKSVVQMKSGETIVLTSRQNRSGEEAVWTYILVTGTIVGEGSK